ncbi:MAG TPA: sugar ABC transporter permease [Chloroflexota bacterium]|jgi:multiple sugar transport system permease protein|nr:sugar ABC transporter permease [Chloroflexota bacterium]
MIAAARPAPAARPLLWYRRRLVPYLFILPSFLFLVAFVFWPLARALYLSFTKWAMIGPPPRFVGLNNYLRLLEDPQFSNAVANTVYYTVGSVPTGIVVGLGLALLMNQPLRARGLLRSACFFPTVTSTVAVSLVWLYMFDVHLGVVNYLLALAGLPPQKWLHDPVMAMPVIVLYGLWHGVGYTMMIFLAGLQAIPSDLYEAAMVDGADRRASFRHITLPLLRPVTLFVLITSVIASFKVFDAVYVMTRGGPGYATMPMVQYIYMTAFEAFDMGYASALAMVLFAIVLVLTVVQLRVFGAEAES